MLPADNRMRAAEEYSSTVRNGIRVGRPTLILHARTDDRAATASPRIGFVVSKAVGNAVRRNRVKRRLRSLARQQFLNEGAQPGLRIVVRALPAAAHASYPQLSADLHEARRRLASRCSEDRRPAPARVTP